MGGLNAVFHGIEERKVAKKKRLKRRTVKKRYNRDLKAYTRLQRIVAKHGITSAVTRAELKRAQKAYFANLDPDQRRFWSGK